MSRTRTASIVLLIVTAIGGFAVAPVLLTTHDHRPPSFIPVIAIICAAASLIAAVALRRGTPWAAKLGIGSRAVDILGAIPAFWSGVGAGPKLGAALAIAASLITIMLLLFVQRAQDHSPAPTARVLNEASKR